MNTCQPDLVAAFGSRFGMRPHCIARAPGRVNLIGEHTDYNDGFVLPAAISFETQVAAARRTDTIMRVVARYFSDAEIGFDIAAPFAANASQPWADYVWGMVCAMRDAGHRIGGADLVIAGSIPQGAGLSSSASLAVAIGTALADLFDLGLDGPGIARLAQACECNFVGTQCGIMDPLISACGIAEHALLIDCRSLVRRPVPIPENVAIMIVHSGITRGLVSGQYNDRRRTCEAAATALGVSALRDADMAMLVAGKDRMDATTFARARHVITENARTQDAAEALAVGDLRTFGALMGQSHTSMRDDFAITTREIDNLVAELQSHIGDFGGARMTGGGFGGAIVAVMDRSRAHDVANMLGYRTPAGAPPLIMIEHACAGATRF